MEYTGLNSRKYITEESLGTGGEGSVYSVYGMADKVVKILSPEMRTREREEKIKYLVTHPMDEKDRGFFSWPETVLYEGGRFVGYVMPRVDASYSLSNAYTYHGMDREPAFRYADKIMLASHLAELTDKLHRKGYIVGDFNPKNIVVDKRTGIIRILDVDSFHIIIDRAKNRAYRCVVCANGYAAPEIIRATNKALSDNDRQDILARLPLSESFSEESDNFCLAIHIFMLLNNGFTPFSGIPVNVSGSVGTPGFGNKAVLDGNYCYKQGNKPQSEAVLRREDHPENIKRGFDRAFDEGSYNPKARPTAREWVIWLNEYRNNLSYCKKDAYHQYSNKKACCPLCEADARYSRKTGMVKPVSVPKKTVTKQAPSATQPPKTTQTVSQTVYSSAKQLVKQTNNLPVKGHVNPPVKGKGPKAKRSFYELLRDIIWGIGDFFCDAAEAVGDFFGNIFKWLGDNVGDFFYAIGTFFGWIFKGIWFVIKWIGIGIGYLFYWIGVGLFWIVKGTGYVLWWILKGIGSGIAVTAVFLFNLIKGAFIVILMLAGGAALIYGIIWIMSSLI